MENNQPLLNEHNKTEHPPMHTCEHVVNRTVVNLFGCGRAVSAHIERKKSKLDFALAECPSEEQIAEIERVVNETLRKNLPVTMEFISQEEAMGRFDMNQGRSMIEYITPEESMSKAKQIKEKAVDLSTKLPEWMDQI